MIVVQIASGEARNRLDELGRLIDRPRAVLFAAAGSMRRDLQRHFIDKAQVPNKLGGKSTGFWQQIHDSTQIGEVTESQAEVVIGDSRFAQKLYGGTITAKTPWKNGMKLLTIPVVAEAHGRRASVLANELGIKLFFMGNENGGVLAARAEAQGIKVYYACKPSVTQKEDPTALPPFSELEAAAIEGGESYVRTTVQESQTGNAN